ncbi:hypothetical protein EV586_102453 [Tumebacillus sp. BK434]|uniref:hypothetical protein n=1 Tax=Tumebacillus sp. BK434 TaxID=2512169 RepID=UPI001048A1E8|nr:hypothetical protein [Tumebacillus sp. BK434]TCP58005.1 hypothetical protein EV586_102453 [Tumebacillus sp. BK434]
MGGLISFLISLMFFYFGVKKYRQNKKVRGVILLLLGLMFTGGWLPALIGMVFSLVFTLALLAGGAYIVLKLINKLKHTEPVYTTTSSTDTFTGSVKTDNGFEDDWKAFLKKQGKN